MPNKVLKTFEPCLPSHSLTRGVVGWINTALDTYKTQLAKMAKGVHYVMSYDIKVSEYKGTSSLEDCEKEIEALLRAMPRLSGQQRKHLVYRNLDLDVRSELSCQSEKATAEAILQALKGIYEDRDPLNTPALEFYGCRQGTYETLRHYSHRLNKCFKDLQR